MYSHYSLRCPRSHDIPIPPPTRAEIGGSPQGTATGVKRAIFVCPYCGIVSVYSELDIQEKQAPTQHPFLGNGFDLVSIHVGCDGQNCAVPTEVHMIVENAKETSTLTAVPKDWKFADNARCSFGHKLEIQKDLLSKAPPVPSPF